MDDLKNMLDESRDFYKNEEKKIISLLVSLPKGRIRKKKVNSDHYYYLQYRKGAKVVDEYLGKYVPEKVRQQLAERKNLEKELKEIRKALALLQEKPAAHASLTEPIHSILRTMTDIGLWEEGVELIGSWCFLFYQRYLNIDLYPVKTEDLDFLIPYPYKGKNIDLALPLKNLGFRQDFNSDGSTFFTGHGMRIEFLAPERGRGGQKPARIDALSITPQTLRFMDMLLDNPLIISVSQGIKVRLPSPISFLFHKLLISPRRRNKGKSEKDLRQAILVGGYVLGNEEQRALLAQRWNDVPKRWKSAIHKSLLVAMKRFPSEQDKIIPLRKLME
ncbi:MAG TPA: GSU2403 family nucleotidyltransferase fold protein [Thermoanaerobaculia bacterium]|nr:GSU2403 family nucleotidyltransferase fold protein [Thermoanaerobaculia bacterium]HUM31277.1 GSU2403 family nucleotidyltransferase fold protein [Thermoanaerobaculia bacterium]HXK69631.1 GSU2403 family nucleotidyltransferase fold protein [Thermoanaerobaculia bacterium]